MANCPGCGKDHGSYEEHEFSELSKQEARDQVCNLIQESLGFVACVKTETDGEMNTQATAVLGMNKGDLIMAAGTIVEAILMKTSPDEREETLKLIAETIFPGATAIPYSLEKGSIKDNPEWKRRMN